MWFGDLVTMDWFDDVWMKEVFANFMAAKIVNPSFPEIDHDLRFFLAHHPSAYGIDRTDGANPIRQGLDNLNEAGTLYGAIIYQKAPIVMKQLEQLIGEETMRRGLREYLAEFTFKNATWLDLITILDRLTDEDLDAWSKVWVEEPGRPTVAAEVHSEEGTITDLSVTQTDPRDRGRRWTQRLNVTLGYRDGLRSVPIALSDASGTGPDGAGLPSPRFVLAGGDGLGYAYFPLDKPSRDYLTRHLPEIEDGLVRSVAWMSLWESVLYHQLAPATFIGVAMEFLPQEDDEQNVQRVLGFLRSAFWRLLSSEQRTGLAPRLERLLWSELERAEGTSRKAAFFNAYVSIAVSRGGTRRLMDIWDRRITIDGLPLAERHFTSLAQELAVRGVRNAQEILDTQIERIENPDRRARFSFVMPALSPDEAIRDSVFESLKDARNREREPWTLSVVSFLHHPLRSASAEKYILPSLELVEEIQQTGDIFFPLRWLTSTLGGHRSPAAAAIVREFLAAHPDYPPRLRGKILQAADLLFRAAEMPQP
jgi:aminopeptidase N